MGETKVIIYYRAKNLALAGLLESEENVELPVEEEITLTDYLESQIAISFATTWGSMILVYHGIEVPVYIGRLPPTQYFYLGTNCNSEAKGLDDELILKFWAYLSIGRQDKAFDVLNTQCLPLHKPAHTCLSYVISPVCEKHFKMKLSPAGLIEEEKLPKYARSSTGGTS